MKRLAIYFYFDKDGWVGDFAPYYLEKLKEFCTELCVVVNEPLSPEGRKKLEERCDVLLVRENKGFDSWAYKYALEYYGFEKIKEFDELLLNNFTCYGPIYPFKELFDEMDSRDCDFWGINRHPELNVYLTESKDSYIFDHIQSYFINFKSKIINDKSFEEYWDTLKPVTNYNEAIAHHELRCTRYFEGKGFKSSTYMDFEKYKKKFIGNSSVILANEQHIIERNPLVKRKIFYLDNKQWIGHSLGRAARETLDHIDSKTDYDVDLIWQDLLRTQKMSVLRNNLHLNYFLHKDHVIKKTNKKLALIFFVYYEDLIDTCVTSMRSMPSGSTIYIISAKEALLSDYRGKLSDFSDYHLEFIKMENRGRDVSAYLVAAADVYKKHDYICCVHDKKSTQLSSELMGKEFFFHCIENTLASKEFVENVINTFEEHPRLGMLVPPTVCFADYYPTLGREMGSCEMSMRECYEKLSLSVPFDDEPVAPFGTMFWVRGKAFCSVFNHKWKYNDFPEEPLPIDGTILHGMERVYPMTVQNDGYYTSWVATQEYASLYLDNITFTLREINKILYKKGMHRQWDIFTNLQNFCMMTIPNNNENNNRNNSIQDTNYKKYIKLKYRVYKILYKISFGKIRKKLKAKYKNYKGAYKSFN